MKIELTPEALAQIAALPVKIRGRIDGIIERLKRWPEVSGVKWLSADWRGHARIRTGDYRVIFKLVDDDVIAVVRIAHRKDAYAE